ncbi:hypothetical protein [Clostridium sp. YIM B02551]|uniref:hypothetical protein n=1 Tax=Clostridium sp. YIM B02551 TaxID=2910679 RepID=UPI001EEA9AAD|nr:hypothetical protein [Clostridium sp. YIM B02551]
MQAEKLIESNENVYDLDSENIYFPRTINQFPDFTQMPFIPNPYFMARTHYDEEFFQDPDAAIEEDNTESEDFRHKKSKGHHCEEHEKEHHKEEHHPQKFNYEIYAFEYESHPYQKSLENQNLNPIYNYNPYTSQNYMPYATQNNMPCNTQNNIPYNYQYPMYKFDPFFRFFIY